jgi:2-polyprenyl-3-methyl-5-hydroxy-6-metoxy-1,4-benzoquinol methylase
MTARSGPESLAPPDRLRIKLAWLNDHGVEMDDSWLQGRLAPGARVCDLGCGNGGLLARLDRLGREAVGVEPDPIAREVGRGRGHEVLPGTAEELPDEVRDRRFDCVAMSHVLEHCLDPTSLDSSARREPIRYSCDSVKKLPSLRAHASRLRPEKRLQAQV